MKKANFTLVFMLAISWGITGGCMSHKISTGLKKNYTPEQVDSLRQKATQGDKDAQYEFGLMHDKGRGVQRDDDAAVAWLLKAAEQGQLDAQYELGYLYYNQGNKDKMLKWWHKAAEAGHAKTQYQLAFSYHKSRRWPQDKQKALHLYHKSAKGGNDRAQYELACMYHFGEEGLSVDHKRALKLFRSSSLKDFKLAQLALAQIYYNGEGTPKNYKQAYIWAELAVTNALRSNRAHNDRPSIIIRDKIIKKMNPTELKTAKKAYAKMLKQVRG